MKISFEEVILGQFNFILFFLNFESFLVGNEKISSYKGKKVTAVYIRRKFFNE
jgi:hypothetical protein